jgi:hypothetical protein
MARIALDDVCQKIYEDQLTGKCAWPQHLPGAGRHALQHEPAMDCSTMICSTEVSTFARLTHELAAEAEPSIAGRNSAERKRQDKQAEQRPAWEADSELDALDADGGADSDSDGSDAGLGAAAKAELSGSGGSEAGDAAMATASSNDTASDGDRGARAQTSSASGGTSSEQQGDSDLEGLPTMSAAVAAAEAAAARGKGKGRQGKGEAITEEGVQAHKLGLAFERVLAHAPKTEIMAVRSGTMPSKAMLTSPVETYGK